MRILSCLFSILILAGCGGSEAPPKLDMPIISLNATSDLETPVPMTHAAFVPNSVASWTGHIILLGEDGSLWRTTGQGEPPQKIDAGPFSDIRGLYREQAMGSFIALTQSGELRAFIESPEEAGMFPLPVSAQDDLKLTRFCTGPEAMSFWAMTDSGKLANVRAEITDDAAIALTVTATEKPPAKIQICSALLDGTVYAAARTKKRASLHMMSADGWSELSGFPALSDAAASKHGETVLIAGVDSLEQKIILSEDGAAPKRIDVQPGLSIGGLDTASFITATDISMGSVFNQGIIVAGDAADNRLVFIALPYAARTLAEP